MTAKTASASRRRRYHVARFDNRDTGLSTHFAEPPAGGPWRALAGGTRPLYTARDMIGDGVAVLDALGWDSAHVLGTSLGAWLAQGMALLHPGRVRSLTLTMSGGPATAGPWRLLSYLRFGVFREARKLPEATTPERAIDNLVALYRAFSSPGYPFPEQWAHRTATLSHTRSPRDPRTTQRQLAAVRAAKLGPLSGIGVPTLVVSGADDPLIRPRAGRDLAARIPGARFVLYPGAGHTLPEELWDDMIARMPLRAG